MDGAAREELDNFLPCRFECRGVTWTSAEHCFQAAKFPHDPERAELVRNAASLVSVQEKEDESTTKTKAQASQGIACRKAKMTMKVAPKGLRSFNCSAK